MKYSALLRAKEIQASGGKGKTWSREQKHHAQTIFERTRCFKSKSTWKNSHFFASGPRIKYARGAKNALTSCKLDVSTCSVSLCTQEPAPSSFTRSPPVHHRSYEPCTAAAHEGQASSGPFVRAALK